MISRHGSWRCSQQLHSDSGRTSHVVDFFGLSFKSPSRTKLSAVATMESSFERGAQPSMRLAFSLVAFRILPSSGRICFTAGSRHAAMRTNQSGSCRVGTLRADAPIRSFSILARRESPRGWTDGLIDHGCQGGQPLGRFVWHLEIHAKTVQLSGGEQS